MQSASNQGVLEPCLRQFFTVELDDLAMFNTMEDDAEVLVISRTLNRPERYWISASVFVSGGL